MRMRFPALQNNDMDDENANHKIIPDAWRATANIHDVDSIKGPNGDNTAAKKQREYLQLYFNSETVSVPWQDYRIWVVQWTTYIPFTTH